MLKHVASGVAGAVDVAEHALILQVGRRLLHVPIDGPAQIGGVSSAGERAAIGKKCHASERGGCGRMPPTVRPAAIIGLLLHEPAEALVDACMEFALLDWLGNCRGDAEQTDKSSNK